MAYKTRTIKMKIKFIFLTLCLSAMVISCVSLASSDENSLSSSKSDTESPDSGNHSGGGSESSKGTEIRKNVSVAANYADFSWDISVSVSKQSLCPSSEIRYGYMFGYAGFVYILMTFPNNS